MEAALKYLVVPLTFALDCTYTRQLKLGRSRAELVITAAAPVFSSPAEDCGEADDSPGLCSSTDLCQSLLAADGYSDLFTGVSADNVQVL